MSRTFRHGLVVLAALGSLAAGAAHAEGLYAGGALTAPDYSSKIDGYGTGDGGRGPGFKLYAGDELTPHLGVEAGVFNLGRSRDTDGSARAYGAYVDGVGRYEFAPDWTVKGSVGLAEARLSTPDGVDGSPALKLGLGVDYALTKTTSVELGYDRYRFTNAFDQKPDVGQTTLGLRMAF